MRSFVHTSLPTRVVFGAGTVAALPEEVDRLGLRRVLVVATPAQAADATALADRLGARAGGVFAAAAMHVPYDVTLRALAAAETMDADGVVAFGGGSATGLAKAIALRTDLPQVILPTTYAGSEMTPIHGETRDGRKITQRTPRVQPETVIYDVDLTLTLPAGMSVTSGFNAIAHAAEALYAPDTTPVINLLAEDAIASLGRALPRIVADPADASARWDALYGAWLAGSCLGVVSMSLHHKLCHVVGGSFNLPHAETHTILLPHALAYNAPAAPGAMAAIARALGAETAPEALFDLAGRFGAPRALRDIGMAEPDVDVAVGLVMQDAYANPRPLERDAIRRLLAAAWAGDRPAPG